MASERVGGAGNYVLTQEGLVDEEGLLAIDLEAVPAWIQGENRLLCEMLCRGYADLNYADRKVALEAEEWMLDEEHTQEDIFSVPWICMHLNLDIEDVRRRVRDRIIARNTGSKVGLLS